MSETMTHNGSCAFCGSTVDRSFITCKVCGATWRTVVTGWGALTVQASWIVAIPAAIVAGVVCQAVAGAVVVAIAVMIGMIWLGTSMRTSGWFR